MALAPYFDKAALAAASILQGFDRQGFELTLERNVVALAFDASATRSTEGRITLDFTVNLLGRLYPRVMLLALDEGAAEFRPRLVTAALRVNPLIEIVDAPVPPTACLVVGKTSPDSLFESRCSLSAGNSVTQGANSARSTSADCTRPSREAEPPRKCELPVTLYIGSDGWIARVSPEHPVESGVGEIPFGAAAAACFGAANVFRVVFEKQLSGVAVTGLLDRTFSLSTLDLDPVAANPANPLLGPTSLHDTYLIGVGAVGNAAAWALARVPGLIGVLNVIDGERLDATNPQRYTLAESGDESLWKVDLAAREFARCDSGINVRAHRLGWGQFLARTSLPWRLGRVAVAVDSAQDRIAIQASLPAIILNAWTQTGDLGISTHNFVGGGACLACLYLPDGVAKNEDQLVAEALGLVGREMEVRTLLYTGVPIGEGMVRQIAAGLGVPAEPLVPFASRPLRAFYSEALCGGIVLRLQGAAQVESDLPKGSPIPQADTEVPMVFQSALAGVLLAAGIVADAAGIGRPTGFKSVINLLRPLGSYLTVPLAKHSSGRCLCQDADYVNAYKRGVEIRSESGIPESAELSVRAIAPTTDTAISIISELPERCGSRPTTPLTSVIAPQISNRSSGSQIRQRVPE